MKFLLFIVLFTIVFGENESKEILCAEGCSGECLTDYTCNAPCEDEYEQDGSCMTCKWVDPYDDDDTYIVKKGYTCKEVTNVVDNDGSYLQHDVSDITDLPLDTAITFEIDKTTSFYPCPCKHNQNYLQGKWFKFNRKIISDCKLAENTEDNTQTGGGENTGDNQETQTFKKMNLKRADPINCADYNINEIEITNSEFFLQIDRKGGEEKLPIFVDMSATRPEETEGDCHAHMYLNSTIDSSILRYQPQHEFLSFEKNEEQFFYVFVGVETFVKDSDTIVIGLKLTKKNPNESDLGTFFKLDQTMAEDLRSNISKVLSVHFPFRSKGYYMKNPICAPDLKVKMMGFNVEFSGDYSIRIDSFGNSRVLYLQEHALTYTKDENGNIIGYEVNCVQLWSSNKFYSLSEEEEDGFYVQIDGRGEKIRYFTIMTEEEDVDVTLNFRMICPHDCSWDDQNGFCLQKEGKCRCRKGYGGSDCHKLCYYEGKWESGYSPDRNCYFDSKGCDEHCECEEGFTLDNGYCKTAACKAGKLQEGVDECIAGEEGCMEGCACDESRGWFADKNNKCRNVLCGNGQIDVLQLYGGGERKEECDGGSNCDNSVCKCVEGFVSDPNDPTSCMEVIFPTWAIIVICGAGVILGFVLCLFTFGIIFMVMRRKKIDLNIYKQQQPSFHYYITGSTNKPPKKENKYTLEPLKLDFGNEFSATNIKETRFQRMEIKNHSKNKWMMVIFHTPNNPKFVFHFEPQVVYIAPRSHVVLATVYMTLHCTTKIRDMKIPYTAWWSKNKKTLKNIEETLKDKTFEEWSQDDQNDMEVFCKDVRQHIHHNLTITTDAASSTHIDMDELNMSEKPFAEGANGRVFLGNYRSVPVAIKQFNWENLTDEEIDELKQDVINECEMMAKLRNPFIANYMGSVTYLPQISMVIQFFVLGSLGEYLRKDKEDYLRLPYKLKVRMLFDTSRGMQFLHENKIMHLDLKPDNLLVNSLYADSACCIKITDFGTSRFNKKSKTEDKGLGTPIYAAPETYKDSYTFAGDVYAYAVTAWEIFYQDEPYKDFKSLFEIKDYVLSGKRLKIDETMPVLLDSLIRKCWAQNAEERITFDEVTRFLIKIDDDAHNHIELDNDVNPEAIERLIENRTQKLQRQMREMSTE